MTGFSDVHEELVAAVPLPAGARLEEGPVAYEHDGQALEGYAVHDAAVGGRKPAVVVVHDWTGLREYPRARAHMLARLGYFAFAADVYGVGRRFDKQADASAEAGKYYRDLDLLRGRLRAAYDLVAQRPEVDPDRIAVIGYCFGGTAAIELARAGARLRATVAFHAGLLVHEPADVAEIKGALLVCSGGSDSVVPDDAVVAFTAELRAREDLDWQVNLYAGAPHGFTLPGTHAYRPVADRRAWRELTGLLEEVFTS